MNHSRPADEPLEAPGAGSPDISKPDVWLPQSAVPDHTEPGAPDLLHRRDWKTGVSVITATATVLRLLVELFTDHS